MSATVACGYWHFQYFIFISLVINNGECPALCLLNVMECISVCLLSYNWIVGVFYVFSKEAFGEIYNFQRAFPKLCFFFSLLFSVIILYFLNFDNYFYQFLFVIWACHRNLCSLQCHKNALPCILESIFTVGCDFCVS